MIKTIIGGPSPDLNPREHRLQRQDAKSRKTFKMKRQKTKTTSVRRFMSRRGNDTSDTESNSTEGSPTRHSRRKKFPEQEALTLHRTGTGTRSPRSGSPRTNSQLARSVETIPESLEDPKVLCSVVLNSLSELTV